VLLHRVRTSTSFASAHVFPGGNLDPYHDGEIPEVDASDRHQDGPSYRIGAIRETFEETGILLAKRKDGSRELLSLEAAERDAARKRIHGNEVKFTDWLDSVGGVADTGELVQPSSLHRCD
jgi:8-oxo-dGTP pyrophosphatase MutT (NUDIX family)